MENNLRFNPMRTIWLVLLILCIFSPVQCNAQNVEPKVGMIQFSIDVFDSQKEKVEKEKKRVEKSLKEFLKKDLQCKQESYFGQDSDVIAYSDIEDPDVTLDPQFESRADKKLKELSENKKNKLDAIVFGHFKEEDDLIVVFRCYFADENIPKEKRIFSTQSKHVPIDENLEVNLKNAVDELALELEKELTVRFKKTQPEVKKEDAENIEVKPSESSKAIEAGVQDQTVEAKNTVEEMLTARELYNMIIEKGFYCETVEDSKYHDEGMQGINKPDKGIFIGRREVIPTKEKEFIKTESKLNVDNDETIVLRWPLPDQIFLKEISFQAALAKIDILNKDMDANKKWRIPTILELFSIIKQNSKNRFPEIFNLPQKKKDIILWSSTMVKKEGTKLEYGKKYKAYWVVRSVYNDETQGYSVTFASYDIEGDNAKKACLIPVYSDKVYRFKSVMDQLEESDIPGFGNTETSGNKAELNSPDQRISPTTTGNSKSEKIPGFDDVPEKSKSPKNGVSSSKLTQNIQTHQITRTNNTIKIALFPRMWKGGISQVEEQELNDILDEIEKDLNLFKLEVNYPLIIEKKSFNSKHQPIITRLFNILNESDINKVKYKKIYSNIMDSEKINIIIAINFSSGTDNDIEILKTTFINSFSEDLCESGILCNVHRFDNLKQSIRNSVKNIIDKQVCQ